MLTLPDAGPNARQVDAALVGFEWWYLQIVSERFIGTIVLHTTPMLGGEAVAPYLSVWFRTVSGASLDMKVSQEQFEITAELAGWSVAIDSDRISLRGTLRSSHPGARLLENRVVARVDGEDTRWEIPICSGRWDGDVRIDDESAPLSASGYQDHNWGIGTLSEYFKSWTWSALSSPNAVTVNADVRGAAPGQRFSFRQGPQQDSRGDAEVVKSRVYADGLRRAIYSREMHWTPGEAAGGFVEALSFE